VQGELPVWGKAHISPWVHSVLTNVATAIEEDLELGLDVIPSNLFERKGTIYGGFKP
jgi:hypothetical protein